MKRGAERHMGSATQDNGRLPAGPYQGRNNGLKNQQGGSCCADVKEKIPSFYSLRRKGKLSRTFIIAGYRCIGEELYSFYTGQVLRHESRFLPALSDIENAELFIKKTGKT